MKVFFQLSWFFRQEKRAYIAGILLLLLVAFLQLVPPRIIGIVVDEINHQTLARGDLIQSISVLVITAICMYIFRYCWRIMIFGSSAKLSRQLRQKLFFHFSKMPQSFYQKRRVGDLMAHATNDLQAIQQMAGSGVLTLVDSLATGSFVIIAMATTISWKLTLISLIPMPIMALLTSWYGTLLHARFFKAQEAFSSLNDKVQESISGIKVIKTFGQQKEEIEDFKKQSEDVVQKNISVAKVDALYDPTIALIVGVSFFLSILFGARLVLNGELTIGQLVSFTTYLGLLIWPMLAFGWFFNIVERGRASYDRVTALLREKGELADSKNAVEMSPTGNIQYQIKQFTYPGEKEPVVKNIHFIVKKGETIGIVGKTGSGKSTLLKLLMREFDAGKGEILFGEKPLTEYKINSLREAIGYVPQDHFLFSATIQENIAFASPSIEKDKIFEAAAIAKIHDDILQFQNGYETMVGERGVSLSGGQKQRISIARALLMDPEVLLLDDSLSAVDAKTEEEILSALKENRKGKTTIITAHRLSAVQHANLIVVLDKGEIIEKGSHRELMRSNGWYKEMFLRQQLEQLVEHGG